MTQKDKKALKREIKESLIMLAFLAFFIISGILFAVTFLPNMAASHSASALFLNPFLYIWIISSIVLPFSIIYYGNDSS